MTKIAASGRLGPIDKVAMSITAATGAQLQSRGITDPSQLAKLVPGFNFNSTSYGAPVYTIRGVGFQESSLAAAPAVSVYVDEVPLPYSMETLGATLDIERVEVLKGPQGTLYGQNSTGGAVNYVAAKPTSTLQAGVDASYGRFNTVDLGGFVSGPLTSNLNFRVSARSLQGDAWQRAYSRVDSMGATNQLFGRLLLDWQPTDRLSVSLNVNGWRDHSQSQAQQGVAILSQTTAADLYPDLAVFPMAPHNARAAEWDPGVNFRKNNRFYQSTLRADYELTDAIKLTSISSYQKLKRYNPVDGDATPYQSIYFINAGQISTFFQELRLSGELGAEGHWIVGGNYQRDKTHDISDIYFSQSSSRPLDVLRNQNRQNITNKAVYGNFDYQIASGLTVQGGIRYTKTDRSYNGCSIDIAGTWIAAFGNDLGGCITTTVDGTLGVISSNLNQDNVSWRAGIDYKPTNDLMFYANISKGYKAGSFPILSAISYQNVTPVTQESLLAYEAGVKATLFDRRLQLNAAGFYYDYKNKQIRGKLIVPIFNTLEALINIPKSHVAGFELSATARPVQGLTISPSVTMVASKIDGTFINYNSSGILGDFSGEPFPYTPKWSGNTDVEYRFPVNSSLGAFVGANVSYQSGTYGSLGQLSDYHIRGYALLDLRAGIDGPNRDWTFTLWGRNVTNQYYWTTADHFTDVITRYAGMPVTYGASFSLRFR